MRKHLKENLFNNANKNSEKLLDYYSSLAEMYPGHLDFEKPDTSNHALLVIVTITSSISFQASGFNIVTNSFYSRVK